MKPVLTILTLASLAITPAIAGPIVESAPEADAFADMRRPITNPTLFDAALPSTKLHAIFLQHKFPGTLNLAPGGTAPMGGDLQLYALQFEYAFNERLSLVALKDGYIDFNPDNTFTPSTGFANLGAGLKYAFYLNPEKQEVASVTAALQLPTGNTDVFQGAGDGSLHLTVQGLKLMDRWQFAGATGVEIPFDQDFSTIGFASGHISYEVNRFFIPLVEVNAFQVLDNGDGGNRFGTQVGGAVPALAPSDGVDLLNFGASSDELYATVGFGFQSRLTDELTFGVAYEIPLTDEGDNLTENRLTIDLSYNF